MGKLVITGASGNLGSILIPYLSRLDVDFLVINRSFLDSLISSYSDDLYSSPLFNLLRERCPHGSTFLHMAAAPKHLCLERMTNSFLVNSYLPYLLADISSKLGFSRLISLSSSQVYSSSYSFDSNEYPRAPDNMYGLTKLLSEECLEYSSRMFQIPVTILRLSNIISDISLDQINSSTLLVPSLIRELHNKKRATVTAPSDLTKMFVPQDVFLRSIYNSVFTNSTDSVYFKTHNIGWNSCISVHSLASLVVTLYNSYFSADYRLYHNHDVIDHRALSDVLLSDHPILYSLFSASFVNSFRQLELSL